MSVSKNMHAMQLSYEKTAFRRFFSFGARSWTRTNDPLINSQVL